MSVKVQSPLVDVAMNYVNDVNPDLKQETLDHIRLLFDNYISKTISYDKISYELSHYLENLTPLEKISGILSISLVPTQASSASQLINASTKNEDFNHHKTSQSHSYNNYNGMNLNSKDFSSSSLSTTPLGKNRKKTRSWTEDEDQRLLMGVHLHGLENWTLVAQFVGNNRTRSMCSQRWIRVLDPKISKNHWTEDEDQQLIQLVQLYGEKSWMKIASKLGNRSDVQCRYHYKQLQRESKDLSASPPSPSNGQFLQKNQNQQPSSIFPSPLAINYNFPSSVFAPIQSSSDNITPSPSSSSNSISTKALSSSLQNLKQETPQNEKNSSFRQFDLSFTEKEFQFKLDEPFGIDESFDFFKTDPMFGGSFWAC